MKEFCKRGHARIPENLKKNGNCKSCDKERWQSPEVKAKRKEYQQPQEILNKRKLLDQSAERKAYMRKYNQSEKYKAYKREYHKLQALNNNVKIGNLTKKVKPLTESQRERLEAEQKRIDRIVTEKERIKLYRCESLAQVNPEYFMQLKQMYEARA